MIIMVEHLHYLRVDFLGHKINTNNKQFTVDFIKNKYLRSTEDTAKIINTQVTDWEKTFATCISDKRLVSQIYKEFLSLNNKKTKHPIRKSKRQDALEGRGLASKKAHERVLSITSYQWNADLNHSKILIPVLGNFAANKVKTYVHKKTYTTMFIMLYLCESKTGNIPGVHHQNKQCSIVKHIRDSHRIYQQGKSSELLINTTWMNL